jgi:hypothetical protein
LEDIVLAIEDSLCLRKHHINHFAFVCTENPGIFIFPKKKIIFPASKAFSTGDTHNPRKEHNKHNLTNSSDTCKHNLSKQAKGS